jgi:hypothetical protein
MVRAQPAGTGCNGYVHLGLMYGFRASFDKTGHASMSREV